MGTRSQSRRLTPDEIAARFGRALSPAIVHRVGLFAPLIRQEPRRRRVVVYENESGWGRARVAGMLTQKHAQFLEACLATAVAQCEESTGEFTVIADPYRIMGLMGSGSHAYGWLETLCEDLRQASVQLWNPQKQIVHASGILSAYGRAVGYGRRPPGHRVGLQRMSNDDESPPLERDYIWIRISTPWWALWGRETLGTIKRGSPRWLSFPGSVKPWRG